MSDPSTPSEPSTPVDGSGSVASDAPPKWFLEYQAKVDGRLAEIGKDFGRIRDKLPKEEPKADAPKAEPKLQAELNAAMMLGELRARLPPKALAKLNSRIESGESFSAVKSWAEDILDSIPEQSAPRDAKPQAPTGIAATAGHPNTPSIRSRKELFELSKRDWQAYSAWMDSNDHTKLR